MGLQKRFQACQNVLIMLAVLLFKNQQIYASFSKINYAKNNAKHNIFEPSHHQICFELVSFFFLAGEIDKLLFMDIYFILIHWDLLYLD